MVFDLEMIKKLYELYPQKVEAARTLLKKPLTLSEKILYTHLIQLQTMVQRKLLENLLKKIMLKNLI